MNEVAKWRESLLSIGIQAESHLTLFTAEAVRYMTEEEFHKFRLKYIAPMPFAERCLESWDNVEQPISDWLAEEWKSAGIYGEQCRRVPKFRLFKLICMHCRDHPDALSEMFHVVARCKDDDPRAFRELLMENLSPFAPEENPPAIDAVSQTLEPQYIFPELLKRNPNEYVPLLVRAEALYKRSLKHGNRKRTEQKDWRDWDLEQNEMEIDGASCALLRGLPLSTDMDNLLLEADSRRDQEKNLKRWRPHNEVQAARGSNWEHDMQFVMSNAEPTEPRDPQKYAEFRKAREDLDFEPDEYQLLKKTQLFVHQPAVGRQLWPDIIRTHLETAKREGQVARCVMLVPTVLLVDQQRNEIAQYLAGHYWVDGFSGCENFYDGRAQRVLACDICVMTPQILLNMLNSVLETERVYFADFTLVIFDECHHCDKGHPYKLLMDQLAELDNTKNGKRRHIQIVGLTASLGVGDTSWDMAECQRHMLSLCANLRAETISSVRQQLENLKEYVTPPVDHVVKVNRPVNNGFVEAIKRCMGEIQRSMQVELQSIVEQRKLPYIANDDILFPNVDDQFQYQTRVGLLKKYLQRLDEPVTRVLLLCSINHLSHYFYAITISDLLPNSFALDYLNKKMAEYTKRSDDDQFNQINANLLKRQSDNDQFNRINAILLKRYKDNDQFKLINATLLKRYNELLQQLREIERLESEEKEQNKRTLLSTGCINKYLFNMEKKEILNRLYRILFEQFAKKSDSRALIFVATRACAQRLAKHLMELDLELPMFYNQNNVGHMVSANASGTMGGQSSDEQRRMREGFSVGLIKVLVVTSVAEEGVNIAACNLIIKYNNVGNERQMIQRRGRARHKDSKSILLALNTGAEQRELCNMRKEAMMMRCIADLQEQEEQTLLKQIEEKTEEMKVNRDEEKKKLENIRDQLMGKRFDLKCTCGTLISCSDRVRSVMGGSLYVCCDPEVWKRSKHTLSHISRRRKFTNLIRWECAKCGELWGHIVKFSNVFLPELRVRSFVLERLDQQRQFDLIEQVGRKWKDIEQNNFNVDAISIADIRSMYEGLLETNPEAHKEYEKQSRHQLAEIEWRHKEQRECALLDE
ncbi:Interferon-induced helicase C domain-containing protein 1 [Globodera pallida]|nr:Interferon-induced helicase C domain-containing protein 1 [Globodera pallida]